MFKMVFNDEIENIIPMRDMMPGDIGVVVKSDNYGGHTVMRTFSTQHFEVMDLSKPVVNACWIDKNDLKVQLLPPGSKVVLEVL